MKKHIVSLHVQVIVEANSPKQAEVTAMQNAEALIRSPEAWVSAATYVREKEK